MATGVREEDPSERAVTESAGRIPGAVRVGNKWRQIIRFSPGGNLIALGATLYRESKRDLADEAKRPENLVKIGTQTVLEQPMLEAAKGVIEGLEQPGRRLTSGAASMAGSFVPTLASDIAAATDKYQRQVKGAGPGIIARTPFRRMLPARTDVLGQPIPARGAFDPTVGSAAKETSDPLIREAIRESARFGITPQRAGESKEEHAARSAATGRLIEAVARRMIETEMYREMPQTGGPPPLEGSLRKAAISKAAEGSRSFVTEALNGEEYTDLSIPERVKFLEKFRPDRELVDELVDKAVVPVDEGTTLTRQELRLRRLPISEKIPIIR